MDLSTKISYPNHVCSKGVRKSTLSVHCQVSLVSTCLFDSLLTIVLFLYGCSSSLSLLQLSLRSFIIKRRNLVNTVNLLLSFLALFGILALLTFTLLFAFLGLPTALSYFSKGNILRWFKLWFLLFLGFCLCLDPFQLQLSLLGFPLFELSLEVPHLDRLVDDVNNIDQDSEGQNSHSVEACLKVHLKVLSCQLEGQVTDEQALKHPQVEQLYVLATLVDVGLGQSIVDQVWKPDSHVDDA